MTETNPRPLKVFLSHAHTDADAVHALYDRLVADGVDAWLDKEKLIPGQDWEREIRKAVREADVVIVCLSKQFNQRGYRQKEVKIALDEADVMPEGEIFIIPARLEECENLESLRKWHWVDLFEDGGYEKLLRSLLLRAQTTNAYLNLKKEVTNGFQAEEENKSSEPIRQTVKLEAKNIEGVFSFLDNIWGRIEPKNRIRTKKLDIYPDNIVRDVTYSEKLARPSRKQNKLIITNQYSIVVFPGKIDKKASEVVQSFNTEGIIISGWNTDPVVLEFEYEDTWQEAVESLLSELYGVFGKHQDKRDVEEPNFREQISLPKEKRKTIKTEYIVAFIGAAATIIGAIIGSPLIEKWGNTTSEPTQTVFADISNTPTLTATVTASTTPALLVTATPTSTIFISPSPVQPSNTPVFTSIPFSLPTSYTLKKGEYPYCIARRFNVDPGELLSLNGISSGMASIPELGMTLKIPQTGNPFPSNRAINSHPVTYTVPETTTVYSIACFFGDVDPISILKENPEIINPDSISAGTKLQIP